MVTIANGALDVKLLRTLHILLSECSVSRTADLLGQTQPTVSLALRRLRELVGDPLLVRSGSSLVPTERGLALRETLPQILGNLDSQLAPQSGFDAMQTSRQFRIVAANCLSVVYLPRIFNAISREAPRARLDIAPMPAFDDLMQQMASGAIDAVIGNWPKPPDHLRIGPLLSSPITCVVRKSHPLATRYDGITMAEYLAADHLSPTSAEAVSLSPIDGRLMELGLKRRIIASVPEYAIAPHVLLQADLVFTTGAPFAEQIARNGDFVTLPAPVEFGAMNFYLLWHDCKHHSPAHQWLRQLLKVVAAELRQGHPGFFSGDRTFSYPVAAE